MKFLISFKKQENTLQGRSVTARMGHHPSPRIEIIPVTVQGFCFKFGQVQPEGTLYYRVGNKEFSSLDAAESFREEKFKAESEWFDSAEKTSVDVDVDTCVESEGSTYAFDAWVNTYASLEFCGMDAAIDAVRGHYSPELYKNGFFAVFTHGELSINEMIEKGWLVE
jgi:hypothetical protein